MPGPRTLPKMHGELLMTEKEKADSKVYHAAKELAETCVSTTQNVCESCGGIGEVEAYRGEPSQGTETIQCPDCK